MAFAAADENSVAVYHTNVLMCIGTDFALIGADLITDPARRSEVMERMAQPGRQVIELDQKQINSFVGNAIELQGRDGRLLVLSQTAYEALRPEQIANIEKSAALVPLPMPTIEMGGGSVRCTIAGIHLARRPD